jgi:hypothetical protein
MVLKASNSVLNLVSPPISNMVLREGTLDNVIIGSHVPNEAFFTDLTDTSLAAPLVGATTGLLSGVYLGAGLAMAGNVLYCTVSPPPLGYGLGLYGRGTYDL